jgi:hypothetical protein
MKTFNVQRPTFKLEQRTKEEETEMSFLPMLIAALVVAESGPASPGGYAGQAGDNGKALGILQIHKEVVLDVNRIYKTHFRHEDAKNPELAKEICELYLRAWAPEGATPEQCARIWNGGPRGHLKAGTAGYWEKVRSKLSPPKADQPKAETFNVQHPK